MFWPMYHGYQETQEKNGPCTFWIKQGLRVSLVKPFFIPTEGSGIRFSFAKTDVDVNEACERLKKLA